MRGNAFIGCAPTRHVQTVQLSLRLAIIQQMNRSMPAACRQPPWTSLPCSGSRTAEARGGAKNKTSTRTLVG